MLSLTVLGSGSFGNSSLVTTDQCRFLVDAGLSARQITERLRSCGVDPARLDGILITHEHTDHVGGLEVFCHRFSTPVYATSQTAEMLRDGWLAEYKNWRLFQPGFSFSFKDLEVQSFYVPHDAVDPVAFVLSSNGGSIGFLTDLGFAPKLALERIRNVRALLVETNHDERLLRQDVKRPWPIKQRIMSRHGHLSNEAGARLVAEIAGHRLQQVVLGHLSKDCNRPDLALEAFDRNGLSSLSLFCAEQNTVSPSFLVSSQEEAPLPPDTLELPLLLHSDQVQ